MIIKTKEFKEATNKILCAVEVDKNAANLELNLKDNELFLNVTNREYYVSVKFAVDSTETFRAVVDASLFLSLISGITAETFELSIKDNTVLVTANKSKYKLAMIYENENLMTLPVISVRSDEKTVEMPITQDILTSILTVNSKELLKVKNLDVNELQRLYYIDETGCFTFTTGACLNSFALEKPVKLLLNDRIVKLFKLFNEDVLFKYGHEELADGSLRSKLSLETPNVYLAAVVTCDDILLNKIQGPCNATKNFINENYSNIFVISANSLSAAISRLMLFTKNSVDKANMSFIPVTINLTKDEMIIKDKQENQEVISIDNEATIEDGYEMSVNLFDLKLVADSCKNDHITVNCGDHRSIVINRGNISNLIPELRLKA